MTRRFELHMSAMGHSIAKGGDAYPNPRRRLWIDRTSRPPMAGAFLLGMATAALAGEYGNMCTMGLAMGKQIKTDCSINSQVLGKTYCFGSKDAMTQFMADPSGNLAKAAGLLNAKLEKIPSELELLTNARGSFHLGEGPFLLFVASITSEMGPPMSALGPIRGHLTPIFWVVCGVCPREVR